MGECKAAPRVYQYDTKFHLVQNGTVGHPLTDAKSPMGESSQVPLAGRGILHRLWRIRKRFAMPDLVHVETHRNHHSLPSRRIVTHRRQVVRILFVDNRESDVELCLQELKRMDFAVSADWVQVPAEFTNRLRTQSYDAIVCEYSMQGWTGMEALELLHRTNQEIPFLLAARNLDEAMTVTDAFLRKGACDCVDKNRLNRLPLAVALAIEEKTRGEERNHAEKELRHSEAHYRALTGNSTYGICHFDVGGRFLDVNEALVAMLGYGSKQELMAVNLATEIIRDPNERARLFESYRQTGHVDLIEVEWKRKDGTPMKVRLSGRQVAIEGGAPQGCEVIAEDVTAQRASEDNLRHLAATDALTGLANYRRLSETLESEIKRSDCTARPFAVLIFDLNGMKRINDSHGHLAGNRALCRLADIFRFSCRSIDTAARYGGDEFAIILPETGAREADAVARRICERLSSDREEPQLSVSVGIAAYPEDGATIEVLFHAADRALYNMKQPKNAA
jgi:diguanylate cyclase (GGDEF)-like protein/PAS domain S-box-containing protein